MKTNKYERKTREQIEAVMNDPNVSRRTKFRIAKETGVKVPGIRNRAAAEKQAVMAYEVSKGPWV